MKETFEDYLMDIYIREEHPLKELIPDGFNEWLEHEDVNDIIEYAEKWGKRLLTSSKSCKSKTVKQDNKIRV